MIGMNPVQIRATVELYPSLRPPPTLPGQGVETSKCCFSACDSTQPRSHQESADGCLFFGAPTENVVVASVLAMAMGLRNQWQSSHLIHTLNKLTKPRNLTHSRNSSLSLCQNHAYENNTKIYRDGLFCCKIVWKYENNTKIYSDGLFCGKIVWKYEKLLFSVCRSLWKCQMQTWKSLQSQRRRQTCLCMSGGRRLSHQCHWIWSCKSNTGHLRSNSWPLLIHLD